MAVVLSLLDASGLDLNVGLADDTIDRGFARVTFSVRIIIVVKASPFALLVHCARVMSRSLGPQHGELCAI